MNDGFKANLVTHLKELRFRVIVSLVFFSVIFCICYYFSETIYEFLLSPLAELAKKEGGEIDDFTLIYTGLTEAFIVYLRVALLGALLISTPFFLWQLYLFIAPGLYSKEKYVILPYLIATPVLFTLGSGVVYYYIFPLAWGFFVSFEYDGRKPGTLPLEFMPSVAEYLDVVVQMMFAFGIAFQLPVVLLLLCNVGILDYQTLIRKRRIAVVIIFIVAAFLTPPDIVSQIGLAVPMLLLYESSILVCKYAARKKK